jgi:hypothetical protein
MATISSTIQIADEPSSKISPGGGPAASSRRWRGEWVEVDWDTALDITARKLRKARDTFGPDSVGVSLRPSVSTKTTLHEQVYPPGGRDK